MGIRIVARMPRPPRLLKNARTLNVTLDGELYKFLVDTSLQRQLPMAALVRQALRDYRSRQLRAERDRRHRAGSRTAPGR
jgi:hypothetical protein